jgi:hypothetical protein
VTVPVPEKVVFPLAGEPVAEKVGGVVVPVPEKVVFPLAGEAEPVNVGVKSEETTRQEEEPPIRALTSEEVIPPAPVRSQAI